MISKNELKELLLVLNYYLLGSAIFGIVAATLVANTSIVFVRSDYGLPISPKAISAVIVILIGTTTGLLAYLVLLPAELRLIRKKNRGKLLAQRLSRNRRKK